MWLAAAGTCGRSRESRPMDFDRMRVQQRYDLYQPSEAFANGGVMQSPPAGTVSRESAADTGVLGSGAVAGVAVAVIPMPVTPALLALGHQKFVLYCAVCHGPAAFGGSVVAWNMGPPRPPSLRTAAAIKLLAGYIFSVATHGKGRMPAFAPQLSTAERWAVAAYVKQLQRTAADSAAVEDSLRGLEIARIDSAAARRSQP
jgi:mono/diheme cytochrome c family protein